MDLEKLRQIIDVFEVSSLSELEIEEKGVRFRLVKKTEQSSSEVKEISQEKEIQVSRETETPEETEEEIEDKLVPVKSPLVGTFYRASSPDRPPFVEEEQMVQAGQTLCIIEAMKVMNEITSEVNGKVKEILVENGHPVEYDQELFLIEKEE